MRWYFAALFVGVVLSCIGFSQMEPDKFLCEEGYREKTGVMMVPLMIDNVTTFTYENIYRDVCTKWAANPAWERWRAKQENR